MKKRKLKILAANIFKLAIIALLPQTLKMQGYAITSLVVLGIFVGLYWFPALIRTHQRAWAENIDFWLSFTLLFNTLGFAFDLFNDEVCLWWDECAHFFSFFILGLFIIYLYLSSEHLEKKLRSKKRPDFFLFAVLLFMGLLWEGVEFSFDQIWGLGMQPSRGDTWMDLQMNALGAFLIILLAFKNEWNRRQILITEASEEVEGIV